MCRETKNPEIILGYAGRYRLDKRKVLGENPDGSPILGEPIEVLPWFDNLITNYGMDGLVDPALNNFLYTCRIGTGNTPPTFADTQLTAQVGSTNNRQSSVDGYGPSNAYYYTRVVLRFNAGTVHNKNLSEIGMAVDASTASLFSKALLRDTSGNPTTITLLEDEVLDVTYEIRLYLTPAEVSGQFMINGVNTTVRVFPSGWGSNSSTGPWSPANGVTLGRNLFMNSQYGGEPNFGLYESNTDTVGSPVQSFTPPNALRNSTANAYVPGSFTRTITFDVPLGVGNFATGIGSIRFNRNNSSTSDQAYSGVGQFCVTFDPKVAKTSAMTAKFTVGLTVARYTP